VPAFTPLLGHVLHAHLKEQVKSDILSQAELATGRFEGQEMTVCFADLVGFTRLGERVAPGELSRAGRRLTEMAVDAARPPVRLVKMIGDAAMLVSPEPEALLHAGLELVAAADDPAGEMPQLRVGVAAGPAISHSGDWFGAPVNLASRLTGIARPASVVATKPVRDALRETFDWAFIGARRFRGVRGEVPVYRARRR
jgi:adenylate cyclase